MTCTHYNFPVPEEKMVRVITDTDLCNEADDPFAVVQALLSPKFDNVGVVAAHFGTRDPNGMQKSWQGLKDLTVLMQLTVPVLHGAPHALPDAATPVPSEGAKLIIREAMKEDTRPLFVLLLGPLTDLASAYLQEPRIAGRLTAIWIGGAPYPVGGPEFNLGNDVNAVNVVFGSTMPVWQVPKNVYEMMPVSKALQAVISKGATADVIEKQALSEGMLTLKMGAAQHVLNGITSISEMKKITYETGDEY